MTYTLDIEMFISEVKKFPEIWDINCEDHRNKNRKQAAWAEIGRLFIPNFDDMTELEKLDVYRKLHGKWRNIRDSFVRQVKKKGSKKGYTYAKQLSFLNAIYKLTDSDEDQTYWSDGEEAKLKKMGYRTKQIDVTENWQDEEETTLDKLKRKRVKKEVAIEYVDTPLLPDATCSYSQSVENEDRSFFESLLPAVKDFNIDQKLEFRSSVISLIKNIRHSGQRFNIKTDRDDSDQ